MSQDERDIVGYEAVLARRIGRLFRYERTATMTRRPDLMNRLHARRGDLIEALMRADATRRHLRLAITPLLHGALRALWFDIAGARQEADDRLDGLRKELQLARGEGIRSGIRGSAGGRVLGRG
jgi:hypothetical protein